MKKKLVLFLVMLFCASALAQDLPRIAVYVTGDIPDNEKKALGTRMLSSLINSGRYMDAERAGSFLMEAEREQQKQPGVIMDNSLISALGQRFDVGLVCVVNVIPLLGEFQISARIVDAVTAGIVFIDETVSPLKTISDFAQASERIVKSMLGEQTEPPSSTAVQTSGRTAEDATEDGSEQSGAEAAEHGSTSAPPVPAVWPPKVSVYVTGVSGMVGKTLNQAVSTALVKSNMYEGITPIDEFVSGAASDQQISRAGEQAGVHYVFVIDVAQPISVKIVDVGLATVLAKVSIDGKVSAASAGTIAKKIVDFILTSGPKPPPGWVRADAQAGAGGVGSGGAEEKSKNRMSLGLGFAYAGDYGGGIKWNRTGGEIAMPNHGPGMYFFLDVIYAELFYGSSDGRGQWKSDNVTYEMLEMWRLYLNFGAFVKFPVSLDATGHMKIFPLLGIEYLMARDVELTNKYGDEYVFDGENGRPEVDDMNALWFKVGVGMDNSFGKSKKWYLRSQLMYGMRTANKFEKDIVKASSYPSETETRLGHGMTVKVGTGRKF